MVRTDALAPKIRSMLYAPDSVAEKEIADVEELTDVLREGHVSWIDVQGLGSESILRRIGEIFGLHRLALEDVVNVPQRPKAESYPEQDLFIGRMARLDGERVHIEQFNIFIGAGYVLTFQERYGDVLDPVRERIRSGKGVMRTMGPDYLAYAIIDAIIDHYYPVVEHIGDCLEDLEEDVAVKPEPKVIRRINQLKRDLLTLRRAVWPMRDAVNHLLRGDSPLVSEPVRMYLRDPYDHCVQLADVIETYRDLAGGLMNTYLSVISNRTNDVMKVLTIMASIFIPLTFLAGIYGMNFTLMPELHARWGYPAVLTIMFITAIGMLSYFRRRGWLGGSAGDQDE